MAAPLPQDGLASQLPNETLDEVLKKADVPTLLKIKGVSLRPGGRARGECSGHGCAAAKASRCP